MNRIYQGRVTAVEILNPDRTAAQKWLPFDADPKVAREKWQAALWQHHVLFQDAVNYYTLALAAMAKGVSGKTPEGKTLQGWVTQVRETWATATRKADVFEGPRSQLVGVLDLAEDADFDTSAARMLQSSRASEAQRAAAVLVAVHGVQFSPTYEQAQHV